MHSKWRAAAASSIGTSHLRTNKPCQDAFSYEALPTGEFIAVVSDGAGSAEHSAEGSALIVEAMRTSVAEQLAVYVPADVRMWQGMIRAAFEQAQQALFEKAIQTDISPRAYAATAILLILTEEWTACGLVGDCVAVVQDEAGELISICSPQKGEYANMTNFLSQENALTQLEICALPISTQKTAILSDGLLELALNVTENRPHAPFFKPLFGFIEAAKEPSVASTQLKGFLNSERVNRRTDDDKTLVLAHRL